MYLMGIDIGTQGTKAIIISETGELKSTAFREYVVETPKATWAQQHPDVWVKAVCETMKECLGFSGLKADQIAAIGISGLYGGSGVPVDAKKDPIYPCLIWMDRRAKKQTEWVKETVDQEELFQITGNYVDSYFGFTKMMWIHDNEPEIWKKTDKFITPKDYVIYKLTGNMSIDYSSAGNIGGVFDLKKKTWSAHLCQTLGIDLEKLPEKLIPSSSIAGKLSEEMSSITGLNSGTPVISGGIDAAVTQFSAGVLEEGEHVAMAGTSMCWGTVHDGKNLNKGLVNFPYVVYEKDKIYTFGGSSTNGAIARWFRDEFALMEKEMENRTGINAYALLEKEIKDVPPGSEGLLALPYFMGERSPIWDPDARGMLIGLSLYHKRKHVYKALLESAAYSLRHNMEEAKKADISLSDDCMITGGVAKSQTWVQIFADVTGYNMKLIKNEIEAPLGDAFLAGLGVGIFKKPEEIRNWIEFKAPIKVNKGNHKIYDKYYHYFLELYENNKTLMRQMAESF
ncbi:MAG: FGGY-family carbohydrate kinase [Thermotogota bacterium]|nr:FGGY-family carbohydrate kinase [Thermotogota bacterium]